MITPRPEIGKTPAAVHGGPRGTLDELRPVELDFSTSVNAWGPAPEVLDRVRSAPLDRYPDPECLAPRRAAAARWGCPIDEIAFGAGAAELIQAAAFAFLRPGDRVVVASPTFAEYERASSLCGARIVRHVADPPGWGVSPEALAAAIRATNPRLAFLCTPNNPTGDALDREGVRLVADACAAVGVLLVLDQSYDVFTPEPLGTPALPGHSAVLCLRSITKDHALAGVRAGFAVGPAFVVAALNRARTPWAASVPAQAAAVAALSPAGDAHLDRTLPRLRAERERIASRLAAIGLLTVPSSTNYLLAEVRDAAGTAAVLRERHALAVRDCTSFGLPRHIRVAARTPGDTARLLAALEAVCSS
jgi:histidinol-phosphate aminotransferase